MKRCPNPKCNSSEDSLEIVEDERCTRNRCCWVHCDWCGVSGPTAGPTDESAIEAWDMLPRITEENYAALKDEFNRGAALAQKHCPKEPLGHSVFEGIPLLAAEVEQIKDEHSQWKNHMAYLKNNIEELRERVAYLERENQRLSNNGQLYDRR